MSVRCQTKSTHDWKIRSLDVGKEFINDGYGLSNYQKRYESYESKQRNRQLLGVWMSSSQVYISTASRDRLRAIARKHFMKESEVLDQLILETHNKMKNSFGRKVLWADTSKNQQVKNMTQHLLISGLLICMAIPKRRRSDLHKSIFRWYEK